MKNSSIRSYLPAAVFLALGLFLFLWPDTALAAMMKLLGWGLLLAGIWCGVVGIFRSEGRAPKLIFAIFCLGIGGWLIRNPERVAVVGGRLVGLLMAVEGLRRFFRRGDKKWGIGLMAAGVLCEVFPLSRLLLRICGLVLTLAGCLMLYMCLRQPRLDKGEDDDPNIIDAL